MREPWKVPVLWTRQRTRAHKALGRPFEVTPGAGRPHLPPLSATLTRPRTTATAPRLPCLAATGILHPPPGVAAFEVFPSGRFSLTGDSQLQALVVPPPTDQLLARADTCASLR